MINVFINGYGTVGKRVADAVALQNDMEDNWRFKENA